MSSTIITGAAFEGYNFEVESTGKIEGLAEGSYAVSESVYAGVPGSIFNEALLRKRQVTLEFLVPHQSEQDYQQKREAILQACNKANGIGELTLTILGTDYLLYAVPEPPLISWPHHRYFTVQVQFVCYDPMIYSGSAESVTNIGVPTGGGAEFPLIFPITFASSGSSGTATAYNNGNIPSAPIMTITGVLTNPLIRNVTTGESFQLTHTSGVGDTIVIDMKNRTVVKNGSTNLLGSVQASSDWWDLNPGANIVALTTGSTSDTGMLSLTWRHAWSQI